VIEDGGIPGDRVMARGTVRRGSRTNNPAHQSAGTPFAAANCSTCHNTITWNTAIFDHSTTGWALTGSPPAAPAGKVVACADCHKANNYTFTVANTDCYGCHQLPG